MGFRETHRLLAIAALLLAPLLPAAELRFKNGDRLTGELVAQRDGLIFFVTPLLGEVIVPETEATVVSTPETPVESLAGLPPQPPPPKAAVPVKATSAATAADRAALAKKEETRWRGKLEFGFQQQSGRRDLQTMTIRADADRTRGANAYRVSGRYLYGKDSVRVNNDRRDASFRWRHEFSDRLFWQSLTSYTSDAVKHIDHNIEQNGGIGYNVLILDRHKASVGTGVTVQYRDTAGADGGATYLGEIFQDYAYKINGRLTLSQDVNAQYSPERRDRFTLLNNQSVRANAEAENYRIRANSTLQGRVSERVSLNLRFEYEYDNAILDPAARVDQRVISSLGYAF